MEVLCTKAEEKKESGTVTYLGVFASGGRQSGWIRNEVSTDELFALIENDMAPRVLACVGSSDRLRMLLALLKGACSVSQLVETCGFSSTGQAYHHLKPLLAADLVEEDEHERGYYIVRPHRVQGIIMVLAGVCDMLDAEYTQGAWDGEGTQGESRRNRMIRDRRFSSFHARMKEIRMKGTAVCGKQEGQSMPRPSPARRRWSSGI